MAFTKANPFAYLIPDLFFKNDQLDDNFVGQLREVNANEDTFHGSLVAVAIAHGLYPKEAAQVIESMMAKNPTLKNLAGRPPASYPQQMYAILWTSLCGAAQFWFDEQAPEHPARAMFKIGSF